MRLSLFMALRGKCFGQLAQQSQHSALHTPVAHRLIGHVDEGSVKAHTGRESEILMVQTVSLACATAHKHTVHSVVQPLFGNGYKERHRRVRAAPRIIPRHKAQRVGQGGKISSARAEELLDGACGAKFFFLI